VEICKGRSITEVYKVHGSGVDPDLSVFLRIWIGSSCFFLLYPDLVFDCATYSTAELPFSFELLLFILKNSRYKNVFRIRSGSGSYFNKNFGSGSVPDIFMSDPERTRTL